MKAKAIDRLPIGVYRLHWKSGGTSVAAVGCLASGEKWFAPANWISGPSTDWTKVESVELIERNFRDCDG